MAQGTVRTVRIYAQWGGKRHSADTKVYWPGQPDPTIGRDAHQLESEAFFKSIENRLETIRTR